MFMPRFAEMVADGRKPHTVRPRPKRMPAAGDRISLRTWTGLPYRSKQRVLKVATISEVMDVEIYGDSIHIAGRRLSAEQRESFAKSDGFLDFAELAELFRAMHGLPFEGIVIYWTP
jgi:hypothetical protein